MIWFWYEKMTEFWTWDMEKKKRNGSGENKSVIGCGKEGKEDGVVAQSGVGENRHLHLGGQKHNSSLIAVFPLV